MTNHEQMMVAKMGGGGMSGMGGPMAMGSMSSGMGQQQGMGQGTMGNNTSSMTMMMGQENAMQSQTGSTVLEGGWTSGIVVKVRPDGDASVFNAQDIHVMVFPHIV
jgi:hypothetical protein